ncbi:AfsR/SARP family transcriptional regulator [Kutzneria buriramensis]|uniref:DNA-binding SARP family transcriptional activator n=1 Tax=Kutzneria buriramensis TaxID=1045776 RepID=A0A3E0H815_9PSEU|nr:AfsR/SARP family transcriptional regulator [Kutzneria buriramensis]REH39437.1 DNA-binding SARP family transcriptional activator [Kutzneria buriramensis]
MSVQLDFRLLGTLEVHVDGGRVAVNGPRQRTVLAMLLLSPDRVVSVDGLVEAVWNGSPPATGRTQVAICVAALRKTFKAAGCADDVIVTMSPGYMLVSQGHRIDHTEFDERVAAAHLAAEQGNLAEAADIHAAALELWRGPALAGVAGYLVETEAARLEEQRLAAYEAQTALRLELGQHRVLISELAAVVREHPLREQARAQLMLAQYRAGRRAEALETFRGGRQSSIEEIGIEPGPELRDLHAAILRDDPTLSPIRPAVTTTAMVAPAQLPPAPPAFTGRAAELSALDALLTEHPTAAVVTGPAGVGKTGLALHWAHRVADQFCDGQLHVDLRGYDDSGPADSGAVLGSLLRALGVQNEQIPADPTERATLYRSLIDGRRVLIVLDNARSFAQVKPLLPGSDRCRVVVTSRNPLGELVGGHGAAAVRLGVFDKDEAAAMLNTVVGTDRVSDDPTGVARLAELCDRLPLALQIAATRLAARPHWSVRRLVTRLEDGSRRLDELDGDGQGPRAGMEASYQALPPQAQRLYRRLGLVTSQDFAAWVGAALLDVGLDEADELIEQLVEAKLLEVAGTRYRFRDLVRLHAREHALAEESPQQRDSATERALSGWLTLAVEAHWRDGGRTPYTSRTRPAWRLAKKHVDALLFDPRDWLDQEHAGLRAAMAQASRLRMEELARGLTAMAVVPMTRDEGFALYAVRTAG